MSDTSSANRDNSNRDRMFLADRVRDVMHLHLHQVELARRWKLSPRTLERWRWEGVGPQYLKVGGRVLYRLNDVEAFEVANLINLDPNTAP